jgi:four helix bundle protein
MGQAISNPEPDDPDVDCHGLDCYRVAIEFQAFAAVLAADRRLGSLRDQLDRASASIVLNIAEGAGRRSAADKSRTPAVSSCASSRC